MIEEKMIRCGMISPEERGFLFWDRENEEYFKLPNICKTCVLRRGKKKV